MSYKDPEVAKRKSRERYQRDKQRILERCKAYYESHKEQHRLACRKWNKKNKKRMVEYYARWRAENRGKKNAANRAYRLRTRLEAIAAYGNQCSCCGETLQEFLAFDHVHGNGRKHRQAEGIDRMAVWLKRHNFPATFRLLCHNCNSARGYYGYCPHEFERQKSSPTAPLQPT